MRLRLPRRSVLLGALLAGGCYSPTLPLPPPFKPEITTTESGAYRLRGGVVPNSQIFALNARTHLIDGQVTTDLGVYDFELHEATAGDAISIWYEAGADLSPTTKFELPDLTDEGGAGGAGTGGSTGAGTGGLGGLAGSGTAGSR